MEHGKATWQATLRSLHVATCPIASKISALSWPSRASTWKRVLLTSTVLSRLNNLVLWETMSPSACLAPGKKVDVTFWRWHWSLGYTSCCPPCPDFLGPRPVWHSWDLINSVTQISGFWTKNKKGGGRIWETHHKGTKSYTGGISPAGIIPLNRLEFKAGQKKAADLEIMVHAGKTPPLRPAPQLHAPSSQHHKRKHKQRLAPKLLL